ncbi:MAG: response regulator [Candidatus Zhuqueibacterota bacterium]
MEISQAPNNQSLILIVDDTPTNLQVLGSLLKRNGYKVVLSKSGKEAIEFVRKKKIDLILLDIMMPEMSGFEVCEQLKSDESTRDIPVLFITALTDSNSKLKAFEAGGMDYVTKPFLPEEVLARVNVNIKRREYEESLLENSRLKSDFVSSVSHELRTPLASILGFSSTILRDKEMGEDIRNEFLKIIHDESLRLSNLIENVLSISRIESRTVAYTPKPIQLDQIVKEVYDTQKIQCDARGITFEYTIENHVPTITADRDAIKRALLNLVSNAVKFSQVNGFVKIALTRNGEYAALEVEDHGLGIPEKDLSRIFQKFYRVDRPGMEIQGTGLGLPIVKDIIEYHKGKIEVTSAEGKGTRFTILLPLDEAGE